MEKNTQMLLCIHEAKDWKPAKCRNDAATQIYNGGLYLISYFLAKGPSGPRKTTRKLPSPWKPVLSSNYKGMAKRMMIPAETLQSHQSLKGFPHMQPIHLELHLLNYKLALLCNGLLNINQKWLF